MKKTAWSLIALTVIVLLVSGAANAAPQGAALPGIGLLSPTPDQELNGQNVKILAKLNFWPSGQVTYLPADIQLAFEWAGPDGFNNPVWTPQTLQSQAAFIPYVTLTNTGIVISRDQFPADGLWRVKARWSSDQPGSEWNPPVQFILYRTNKPVPKIVSPETGYTYGQQFPVKIDVSGCDTVLPKIDVEIQKAGYTSPPDWQPTKWSFIGQPTASAVNGLIMNPDYMEGGAYRIRARFSAGGDWSKWTQFGIMHPGFKSAVAPEFKSPLQIYGIDKDFVLTIDPMQETTQLKIKLEWQYMSPGQSEWKTVGSSLKELNAPFSQTVQLKNLAPGSWKIRAQSVATWGDSSAWRERLIIIPGHLVPVFLDPKPGASYFGALPIKIQSNPCKAEKVHLHFEYKSGSTWVIANSLLYFDPAQLEAGINLPLDKIHWQEGQFRVRAKYLFGVDTAYSDWLEFTLAKYAKLAPIDKTRIIKNLPQ